MLMARPVAVMRDPMCTSPCRSTKNGSAKLSRRALHSNEQRWQLAAGTSIVHPLSRELFGADTVWSCQLDNGLSLTKTPHILPCPWSARSHGVKMSISRVSSTLLMVVGSRGVCPRWGKPSTRHRVQHPRRPKGIRECLAESSQHLTQFSAFVAVRGGMTGEKD